MSLTKKAIGGSIHRIREFELEKVNLADEFDILQIVGEGWFGKILLTEHRSTQTEMVLKALPKAYTGITDFYREFHYGLHLSAHRNIITTYDVAFETAGFYIFSQEYAPLGDLTSNVTETGLGELHAKRVARQLAAAVHHIHSRELVHRDIKLDNILVFRSDFSRIKLCDFGETRRANTIVRRHNEWLPYSPPEVLQIDTDETYKALTSHDVWQFGIVLFVCLTGCIPWQKAAMDDRRYTRYLNWHTATLNIAKKPKLFQLISSRAQRMFKRLLEPKLEKRPVSVLEVNKYLEDRWLAKLGAEKALNGGADERDELSPSMYSFHSSLEEKNQLLYTLTQYGIETTVDRTRKKDRIREWIQSSAIAEENEEESDVEELERANGASDMDEDGSMKGRHFPERRPSGRTVEPSPTPPSVQSRAEHIGESAQSLNGTSGKARRTNTIINSNHRAARTMKRMERRNPFAPQVARERHAVARFASFPNGDPSLGIATDSAVAAENARKMAELEREQLLLRSVGNITDSAGASSNLPTVGSTTLNLSDPTRSSVSPIRNVVVNGPAYDNGTGRVVVVNKAEATNDRLLPTQESSRQSPEERGAEAAGYSQSEQPSPRSPQVPNRKHRSQTAPFPAPVALRQANNNEAETLARRSRSAVALPTAQAVSETLAPVHPQLLANHSNTNNNNSTNNNNNNPLTMSVASHLVMQSFNALQVMNTMPVAVPESKTQVRPREDKNVLSDVANMAHGKDAWEHYGLAQRAQRAVGIGRNDAPRHGSTGSGSRSVKANLSLNQEKALDQVLQDMTEREKMLEALTAYAAKKSVGECDTVHASFACLDDEKVFKH